MNDDHNKRKRYLIVGAIVLILLGVLVYFLFFRGGDDEAGMSGGFFGDILNFIIRDDGTGEIVGVTPPPIIITPGDDGIRPQLVQLTDFPVIGPTINEDGDEVLFYQKDGGDLLSIDYDGLEMEKLSNITIVGALSAEWSMDKDRSVVFYLDGDTLKSVLIIGTSTSVTLPQDIRSFSWSPAGNEIAYLVKRNGGADLILANASGGGTRVVFSTPIIDADIRWITTNKIAFHTPPSRHAGGYIFLFDRQAETFDRITGPLFGFMSEWAPTGTHILTTQLPVNNAPQTLEVRDVAGREEVSLRVFTLPEKCVWTNDAKIFYCAVPRRLAPSNDWPDNYLRGEINTSDRILSYAMDDKKVSTVFSEREFDMTNLLINPQQTHLVFIDRKDGTLWSFRMEK